MLYPSRKVVDTDCCDRYQERMSPRFGVDDGIRARLEEIQSSPLTSNELHMQSPDALEYKVRHLEEQLSSLTNKYEQVVVDTLTPSRDAFPFRRSSLVSGLRNKLQADTTSDTSTAGVSNHDRNPQPDDTSQADIPDTVSVASAVSVEEAEEDQEVEDVVTTIDSKVIRVLIPKSISEPDDLKLQCLKTRKDIEALLKKFVTLKLKLRQAENKHRQSQERLQERIDKLKESNQKLKELVPLVEKQSEHISALHDVLRDTEAELKKSQSDAKRLSDRVTDTERRETALISVVEE
ncbi:MAG: hypothetical protein KVP17_002279 [Porospora cf. gigantea B]|uniref:uncharacterized protein n=1 Tax=Porospora cf. gigantea B TaxID=2853592 RepID=UPI0035719FDF|nr:MAG: hypothetical protein KVP17_002279 [Porospora cf. gigantea B]